MVMEIWCMSDEEWNKETLENRTIIMKKIEESLPELGITGLEEVAKKIITLNNWQVSQYITEIIL